MTLLTVPLVACSGAEGAPGDSCTVVDNGNGTATITCEDGTTATVASGAAGIDGEDGADGATCTLTDNGDGTKTIDCDGTEIIVTDGTDGTDGGDGEGFFPLAPAGVVGRVTDRSGDPLSSGTIYFVPTTAVTALPPLTIPIVDDATNDEPLEDVIAASGSTAFPQATVGANGRYSLTTLPADGNWFVTFVPHADDDGHYPGGSLCRVAVATSELVGTRQDIEVSSATPPDATYVGSGICTTCHGRSNIAHTLHRTGIWSPYETGPLQRISAELRAPLESEFTAVGTTIYFWGYDDTRGFDRYLTSETDPRIATPTTVVSFTVTVRQNAGTSDYEMVLHNERNAADPDRLIRVDTVYGGGLGKQRYLTRIVPATGPAYSVTMPLQYNVEGDDTYGRTSRQWRDYHGDWWYNETAPGTFRVPASSNSFERNCASCHATGAQVNDAAGTATFISDRMWGDFDFTGDGVADEMNIGCETCHGPGSAHWDSAGQGRFIVSPSLLTPERESMICGQCHSRPKGYGGATGTSGTDSPYDRDGMMMIAGTSRNDFLANNAVTQNDGNALTSTRPDFWSDAANHSKSHHQQYSDFIRSAMYRNDRELMTCSSCHDPHRQDNPRQLRADPTDNDALCGGSCHSGQASNLMGHIDTQLGAGRGGMMSFATCPDCHMARTSQSGAGEPGLTIGGVRYWQGDISSHLFDVPDRVFSRNAAGGGVSMPTPFTNSCGAGSPCHTAF